MGTEPSDGQQDGVLDRVIEAGFEPDAVELSHELARLEHRLFGAPEPTVARYVLLERVGAGGGGVVYKGLDPDLKRPVAIKFLRAGGQQSPDDSDSRVRLVREAQAMAQLSHPNVMPVYDVGVYGPDDLGDLGDAQVELHGGGVFVVMQLIEGEDLAAWLREGGRTTREILEAFLAAGRGLAAAHRANLIHRDFKPANVMVGRDGRIRVLDFGIARAQETREQAVAVDLDPGSSVASILETPLTQAGTIMGTPAYMPPEQQAGRLVDARADQYAFCVALFEALAGVRPFKGKSMHALLQAKLAAELPPWDESQAISRRLRRAIERGLSPDRDERFARIDRLLEVLARELDAPRRRRLWLAATGVFAALAAVAGLRLFDGGQQCDLPTEKLEGVWDGPRRDAVARAFAAADVTYSVDAWTRVEPRLDNYAGKWLEGHQAACVAASRGEQAGEVLDRRMGCLATVRTELRVLVDVLAKADAEVVENSVQAVARLQDVDHCSDIELLQSPIPPPPRAVAETVRALRATVAHVRALLRAGKFADARAVALSILSEVEETHYRPLSAEFLYLLGTLDYRTGHYEDCERRFDRALTIAAEVGQDEIAARAYADLINLFSEARGQPERALELAPFARVAVARAGVESLAAAAVSDAEGSALHGLGRYAEARELHEKAIAIQERELEPDHPDVLLSYNRLANALMNQAEYDAAGATYSHVLEIARSSLGEGHPIVAMVSSNLGNVLKEQGRHAEGRAHYEAALRIWEAALGPRASNLALAHHGLCGSADPRWDPRLAIPHCLRAIAIREANWGPDHPLVATTKMNLGLRYQAAGQLDDGIATLEDSVRRLEAAYGQFHPDVGQGLMNFGVALMAKRDFDRALAVMQRALVIQQETLGHDHHFVAITRVNLGMILGGDGKLAEAQEHFTKGLEVLLETLPQDHVNISFPLVGLGIAFREQGDPERARHYFERALALREEAGIAPGVLADTQADMAELLVKGSPADRRRARWLAEKALEAFGGDELWAHRRLEVEAFLARNF